MFLIFSHVPRVFPGIFDYAQGYEVKVSTGIYGFTHDLELRNIVG